jgi:hypothetical protein
MSYSLYKKLGGLDKELIKTSMMINGVRGGEIILAMGVASFNGVDHWEQKLAPTFLGVIGFIMPTS